MIKGKRAVLKISFIILALIIIGFLVAYASGVLAGTHTADVTISPEWSYCGASETFTVNVEHTGGDAINEVRIYKTGYNVPPHSNFDCGNPPSGWTLVDQTGTYGYCQYQTDEDSDDRLEGGEDLDFTFDADMDAESSYDWQIRTYDINLAWLAHYPDITVDCTEPETTKWFIGPQKEDNGVEWIDGVTTIKLQARDDVGEHDSGIDKIKYKNTLLKSEEACWSEERCDGAEGSGDWTETATNPVTFKKENEESCHLLEFYAIDGVGNVEDVNKNCFFVDLTAPIGTKEVGDPKIDDSGVKFTTKGTGTAGWSNEQANSGTYSVKMTTPNPGNEQGRATLPFSGNLGDITSFSYWDHTVNGGTYGQLAIWVSIYLDANDDGNWDYYIQAEPYYTYGPPTLNTWLEYDAYNMKWESAEGPDCPHSAPTLGDYISGAAMSMYCPNSAGPFASREYGSLKIIKIDMRAGYGGPWPGFIGYTDDVVINGQTVLSEPSWWVRDRVTEIELDCTDPEPHPSGDEEVCYKVSFDSEPYDLTEQYCDEDLELIEQEGHEGLWCCVDAPEIVIFEEDSLHDLEYFCRDAVNKKSVIDKEWFKVDSQPPIITKEMIGTDHLGDCPPNPEPSDDVCYVRDDGNNGVSISVEDDEQYGHAVGGVYCEYELWWEDELIDDGSFVDYQKIIFTEDSTHTLKIWCEDALGNEIYDEEIFLVDSEPPETHKRYGEPYKVDPECLERCRGNEECIHQFCAQWISGGTPITLTAEDEKVGVDRIYWADAIVLDEACWEPEQYCRPLEIQMNMVEDDEVTFYKEDEESCHVIQYYSVDKLGNREQLNWQCVFVDNTAPISSKEHGEPLIEDEGFDWVTKDTTITLDCEDQQPHPVEQETLCYRISFDDPQRPWLTEEYCGEFGGEMEDGWCCDYVGDDNGNSILCGGDGCPDGDGYTFYFMEDSLHDLEYYCEDHLGNREEPVNIQWYKVDSTAPETEKIITPEPYTEEVEGNLVEWIDTAHEISLEARDDVGEHDSGIDKTWYMNILAEDAVRELELQVDPETPCWEPDFCNIVLTKIKNNIDHPYFDGKWQLYEGPFHKEEESCHVLVYYSVDKLENVEDLQVNCFFVDKTPPVTSKEYEGPYKYHDGMEWINSETNVILSAYDPEPHPSRVQATYWRNTIVDDRYCWNNEEQEEFDCQNAQGQGEWNLYEEPFQKQEESCHLIEYYSVDNVNKTEQVKKQCVFVDKTPPTPDKTVGEPRTQWDGSDSVFYPEETQRCWNNQENEIECWKVTLMTPITLDCIDPEPHPVDQEHVCFNVEVDGDDETERYCDYYGDGEEDMNNGYCCVDNILEEFMFLEETEHNLKYYCEDYLGNSNIEDIDEEKFKVEGTKFEIPIYKKWNLISVPVVLLNDDPEEVFKDTENIESVWTYDPEHIICGQEWCVWSPNPGPDNLRIEPGWGYWVLAEDPDLLVIGGSLMSPATTPPTRNLVKGWNLIGHYGLDTKNVYCSLFSLIDTTIGYPRWSALFGYDAEDDVFVGLDVEDETNPGEGYWTEMDIPDLYTPTTTCWGL